MDVVKDKLLYVLTSKNTFVILNGETLAEVSKHEVKDYEATHFAYASAQNELWVGDKKGLLHILDADTFEERTVIEKKHNHGVTYVTSSKDGKLVASGDSYRYIYVFNCETKQEVACFPYHTS